MIMEKSNFKFFLILICFIWIYGCGEDVAVQPPAPAQSKTTKVNPAKSPPEAVGTTGAVQASPAKYVYITENRRDPFQPFILLKRPVDAEADLSAQTPLQQYDTLQYKLSAIIVGYGQPVVMVVAPDGKSHVVRKGVKIGKNGGTVVEINKEGFWVEEKYRDLSDVIRTNILEIKLPKREGV